MLFEFNYEDNDLLRLVLLLRYRLIPGIMSCRRKNHSWGSYFRTAKSSLKNQSRDKIFNLTIRDRTEASISCSEASLFGKTLYLEQLFCHFHHFFIYFLTNSLAILKDV